MKSKEPFCRQPSTGPEAPSTVPVPRASCPDAEERKRYRDQIELELVPITDRHEWQLAAWMMADAYEDAGEQWGAVEVFRYVTKQRGEELRNYLHLADALFHAGDVDQALQAAEVVLEQEPGCAESQRLVIDLLSCQGRDWRSYPWRETPQVVELGPELADRCYEWLRLNGAADACELEFEMLEGQILLFDEDGLAELLAGDPRIERIDDGTFPCWALRQA